MSFSFSHFLFVEVEVRERETLKSLSRLHCLVFFLLQKMPTRLPPPFPSLSSQFICPKCRRTNSSLDDGRSLELGLAENPSCCCCCSSCGFVFDADAISVNAGGNWRSSSSAYSGGFSQFDSLGAIAGSTRHNAATGNWVSDDGTAAGKASADLRRLFSSTYFFVLPLSRARVTLCKTLKKKFSSYLNSLFKKPRRPDPRQERTTGETPRAMPSAPARNTPRPSPSSRSSAGRSRRQGPWRSQPRRCSGRCFLRLHRRRRKRRLPLPS